MTDDVRTLAASGSDDDPSENARLVVYQSDGARGTRLLSLPDGAEIGFGRSRAEVVHIDSDTVSRRHAVVRRRGAELSVEDLGSRNGTRVNGVPITGVTALRSGDEISVGPVIAIVSITSRAARRSTVRSTSHLEERLAAEADRGRRFGRSFGVVMLRLEGAYAATDAAVDALVAQLRPMDVVAEYGPDELAILVPEVSVPDLGQLAARLAGCAHAAAPAGALVVRVGAAQFPAHGAQPGELISRARAALRTARADRRDVVVEPPDEPELAPDDIVVADPQMRRVLSLIHKVADTSMTVLITGETGSGKEIVAEALHRASGRKDGPFLRLNCASITSTLLESELFGHERGAFTGADKRKQGYFEAAGGGTLFLDELGEISAALQAKLLRVLEQRVLTRVGGTAEIEVDARVVCATNRDLEAEVQRGAFREDLFFRVSAFTVLVPPLRDRPADLEPLALLFLRRAARDLDAPTPTLSPAALAMMRRYAWPGNVRELRNAMERAVVLQDSGLVTPEHLPDRLHDAAEVARAGASDGSVRDQLASVERAALVDALDAAGGNQTRAARALGLSRRALIYKMEKYGLKRPPGG